MSIGHATSLTPTPGRTPSVGAGSAALEELLRETMVFLHAAARRHGLNMLQLLVLKQLWATGPLSPSALAEQLGISRPGVTSSINILESQGWVVRTHAEGDRRRLHTALTPRAVRTLTTIAVERRRFLESGLAELDADDRAEFERVTSRLAEHLREKHTAGGGSEPSSRCR